LFKSHNLQVRSIEPVAHNSPVNSNYAEEISPWCPLRV